MKDLPDHTLVTMAKSKNGYHEKLNLSEAEYQIYPSKYKIIFKSATQSVGFTRTIVKKTGYRQPFDQSCYYFIHLGKTNNEINGEGEIRFQHEDMQWFQDWIKRMIKGEGQDQPSGSKGKIIQRATKSAGSAMIEEPSKRHSMTNVVGPPKFYSPDTKKRSRFKLFLHRIGNKGKSNQESSQNSSRRSSKATVDQCSMTAGKSIFYQVSSATQLFSGDTSSSSDDNLYYNETEAFEHQPQNATIDRHTTSHEHVLTEDDEDDFIANVGYIDMLPKEKKKKEDSLTKVEHIDMLPEDQKTNDYDTEYIYVLPEDKKTEDLGTEYIYVLPEDKKLSNPKDQTTNGKEKENTPLHSTCYLGA